MTFNNCMWPIMTLTSLLYYPSCECMSVDSGFIIIEEFTSTEFLWIVDVSSLHSDLVTWNSRPFHLAIKSLWSDETSKFKSSNSVEVNSSIIIYVVLLKHVTVVTEKEVFLKLLLPLNIIIKFTACNNQQGS